MRKKNQNVIEEILHYFSSIEGPANPTKNIQQNFQLSRQQVTRYLHQLCQENLLERIGDGRGVKYRLKNKNKSKNLQIKFDLKAKQLKSLGEDQLYSKEIQEKIKHCKKNVISIINHIFTEMVNNVIDHSKSKNFLFSLTEQKQIITMSFEDDGIGLFKKNMNAFNCVNLMEAVAETAKGKRTSSPENHAGEGIYFSSRLADKFVIESNGIQYSYFSKIDDWSMEKVQLDKNQGTKITVEIKKTTLKKPEDVFNLHTNANYEFKIGGRFLVNPYEITLGDEPVSRSEAKRLLVGAEKFEQIILDFKKTQRIGQGFADEVFRVFQNKYPEIAIKPINMNPVVEFMVKRAKASH